MKHFISFAGLCLLAVIAYGQQRIDSSFSFGSNPAKKYSIYVPTAYSSSSPNELMLAFHPMDTARWNSTSWRDTLLAFAEANDLLLLCPDGDSDGNITDSLDYAFSIALLDSVKKWFNVDTGRIYTMGFSMGGKAVYEFGLEHADMFGGFIPIGPAISGSSFVSSTIYRSSRMAFYLVHGANDSPASSFTPMVNALKDHCAYLDSNLMSGVGHTIDFPNRNAILSRAYQWVDSVNLSPKSGTISLVSPISFSSIEFKGFHDYIHQMKWTRSSLQDTCGALTYEVLFDLPGGGFANPLIVTPSDNGGTDTVLTFTNAQADSALAAVGLVVNTPTTLIWTVRSVLLNKYSDTAKAFTIVFTRKNLGFKLTAPSNNNVVTLVNGQNKLFDWSDLNHYISVKYKLLMDDTAATFTSPVFSEFSPNNGANSNSSLRHEHLYYSLMFDRNMAIGDSLYLQWTATAQDTSYLEFASSSRKIWLVRGNVGYTLVFPQNNVLIQSKKGSEYYFTWDSVPRDSVTYEWLFDTLGVNLKDTAGMIMTSDNGGVSRKFFADFNFMDSLMNFYNVDYLDTLEGQWTSRAWKNGKAEYALETYGILIYRAHPVGIEETEPDRAVTLYPNPANDRIYIKTPVDLYITGIEVLDINRFHRTAI